MIGNDAPTAAVYRDRRSGCRASPRSRKPPCAPFGLSGPGAICSVAVFVPSHAEDLIAMYAVFATIDLILSLATWVVIASAILSWLLAFGVINRYNPVVTMIWQVVNGLTEPMLAPIRRILPVFNGVDLSPLVLLIAIFFLRNLLQTSIAPMFL